MEVWPNLSANRILSHLAVCPAGAWRLASSCWGASSHSLPLLPPWPVPSRSRPPEVLEQLPWLDKQEVYLFCKVLWARRARLQKRYGTTLATPALDRLCQVRAEKLGVSGQGHHDVCQVW